MAVEVEEGSRIEARGSGFETRFGADYIKNIPGRRFSMFDLIKVAPGVSPTSVGNGTGNTVSAPGSGVNENAFLLDGTDFTCPCSGGAVAEPGIDAIQEVQVQTVGASAEFDDIQGAGKPWAATAQVSLPRRPAHPARAAGHTAAAVPDDARRAGLENRGVRRPPDASSS